MTQLIPKSSFCCVKNPLSDAYGEGTIDSDELKTASSHSSNLWFYRKLVRSAVPCKREGKAAVGGGRGGLSAVRKNKNAVAVDERRVCGWRANYFFVRDDDDDDDDGLASFDVSFASCVFVKIKSVWADENHDEMIHYFRLR